ncbi:MAG TPA: ComF family protein [Rhodospirillaceae bacterium]|nr:ComF family protein [Rhodospirillaceae bacterium]
MLWSHCRSLIDASGQGLLQLADFLLPPRCLSCRAIVDRPGGLCAACWKNITFLAAPYCQCCGHPFSFDPGPGAWCGACVRQPPAFGRARSVLRYDAASKPMLLRFKHADQTGSAPAFARWMHRAGAALLSETDLLVPVPLHWRRLFGRRYNQAALLANHLARFSGVSCCPDALVRVKNTPSQGALGAQQRRRNVQAAFRLRAPHLVGDLRVLLIDDVLTTGATVEECARVLRQGGAKAVDVLTLARVVFFEG